MASSVIVGAGAAVSITTVSVEPVPGLPAELVYELGTTETDPVPSKGKLAVKVAVKTKGLDVAVSPVTVPLTAVMSFAEKPTGASLKVNVTSETVSVVFRLASTILTTTLGVPATV